MSTYAVRHTEAIIDSAGNAQANAAFTILLAGTTTVATTYADRNKAAFNSTHVTDARGNATFWVDPGYYDLKVGTNDPVPMSYIGEDGSDTLDTSALQDTVAALDPTTHIIIDTQFPTYVRNAFNMPNGGLPRNLLSASVQSTLNKADTALQINAVTSVNGRTGDVVISVGSGTVGDATTSAKGLVQLAGDLAGTADAPTVPGLANKVTATDMSAALATKVDTSDARLSDARPPMANSVSNAHIPATANIAQSKIAGLTSALSALYTLPGPGMPSSDMTSAVQASLALANAAVQTVGGKIAVGIIPGPLARTTSSDTTVAYNDFLSVDASSGNRSIAAPTSATGNLPFTVRKSDDSVNTVTVVGTVNGGTNYVISDTFETVTLVAAVGGGFWIQ